MYGGSTAGGNVAFGRDDSSIGAYIDEYDGLGISQKVSDTISVDVGIQMDNDNQSILGEYDNNLGATASATTAFALGVTANVGPTVGFSFGSGSTKAQNSNDSGAETSLTTMGLSLKMDLGGPSIAFSYGSYNGEKKPDGGGDSTKDTDTGMGLSFSMPWARFSSSELHFSNSKTETGSTTNTNASANGLEVGYNTSLGPVAVSIGYGTQTFKADDGSFQMQQQMIKPMEQVLRI